MQAGRHSPVGEHEPHGVGDPVTVGPQNQVPSSYPTQGGPGTSSETLALSMYKETFVLNDYGQGAAIALFLSLVTFAASILYLRYQLGESREQG